MAQKTIADQLIAQLIDAGVSRIYGIVGDSLNPIVDAVRRSGGSEKGGIDWIHVRNEEAAAFAAGAEAQLTGRLAVCAGSCGPGNLHLINGLYDAHRSSAPVLAIASHIPSNEIGSSYFQETHPDRLFVECSNYRELISTAAQAPRVVNAAMRSAVALRGVAVVTLPGDIAELEAVDGFPAFVLPSTPVLVPAEADVRALAAAIDQARTVAIFAGAGVQNAHDEVVAFAELVGAPVGHSLRGKEWIQYDNPYDVGMTGLLGYGAAHAGMHDADLLLLLGTDFPYEQFLPDASKVVIAQVDSDASKLGRRVSVAHPVHGDVAATLTALTPLVQRKDHRFLDKTLKKHEKLVTGVVGKYTEVGTRSPIHPELVASTLDGLLSEDAIVTADTGMGNVWQARYITPNGKRRLLGSYMHGSMANALPQAVGAQLSHPGRQVVSLSGDGGLSMLMGELVTVAAYRLPVTIVVFNNSTLGLVKVEMLVDGFPDFAVDVPMVDYAKVAEAIGIRGIRVEDPRDVEEALRSALADGGPVLVDVVTDPLALSLPPTITGAQVKGFALAVSKIVMNGGAGEAVALARTNIKHALR
ncbi:MULTISPECIES: pyruvate dehydrogenase [unclassified Rathayibacter]|uniref:pyruvate dehydrogenase n=1 Tax=unclassified Rathayibacter TaxID=2609250 RepID=UPI000CE875DA|nr:MULTISPECIES: pyruvate dehydrogenase [unclassified Rathayibacter]PPG50552.1 pyruvate dehydrogenase [Rathayibacter sp. AY2B3]PPI20376.1 pyruvate dehydrogenase [Rathayibacter sp. AY1B5]PPI22765.1 pyruvate dehydrogenase [Rathayibacter sp. AY1B6]PPI28789.1 pyruvate dehydrogenase [Rathayibacter sp. AY1B1]